MALPPELQDAYRNAWSLVQYAATQRDQSGAYAYSVTDVISAAAQLARDAGQTLSFSYFSALGRLFGTARGNANSATALTNADLSSPIDASMIGEWPTAASLAVQAAQPAYMAKAQFSYVNALGDNATGWVTLTDMTRLPQTVNALQLQLQGAALTAYSRTPAEGGSPTTDAEVMTAFGEFISVQLYAV